MSSYNSSLILVIESRLPLQKVIVTILKYLNYEVIAGDSAYAALSLLNSPSQPRLIILDPVPESNQDLTASSNGIVTGLQLLQTLSQVAPDIPVIVTTSYHLEINLAQFPQVKLILPKPFGLKELKAAVEDALS